jgi:hypothetical protein
MPIYCVVCVIIKCGYYFKILVRHFRIYVFLLCTVYMVNKISSGGDILSIVDQQGVCTIWRLFHLAPVPLSACTIWRVYHLALHKTKTIF